MIKATDPSPMEHIIEDVNRYLMEWIGYYASRDINDEMDKFEKSYG